jgi:selenocysteine lyase/cysteine desulfurase
VPEPDRYLDYQDDVIRSAARYEFSTASFFDTTVFLLSLSYLSKIGFDRVMQYIAGLADRLARGLEERGFDVPSRRYEESTSIICVRHPAKNAREIVEYIGAHGVFARERDGMVRLAPHIYHDDTAINRAVGILADAVR